jgi:hypothetical protein
VKFFQKSENMAGVLFQNRVMMLTCSPAASANEIDQISDNFADLFRDPSSLMIYRTLLRTSKDRNLTFVTRFAPVNGTSARIELNESYVGKLISQVSSAK